MADIKVHKQELKQLLNAVRLRFENLTPNPNAINFNSNPKNYEGICDSIENEVGVLLSHSFLRGLFHSDLKSEKEFYAYRESSIEALSEYAFNKAWGDIRNNLLDNSLLIYASMVPPEQDKIGLSFYESLHISAITYAELIPMLKENAREIILYIDEDFLKNKRAANWIIKLFLDKIGFLIMDYSMTIKVSDELLQPSEGKIGIVDELGRMVIQSHWSKIREELKKLQEQIGIDAIDLGDYNKLAGFELNKALYNLSNLVENVALLNFSSDKPVDSVTKLNTFLGEAKNLPPQDLRSIITDHPNGDIDIDFYFYCVISYLEYLQPHDKDEMLSYFYRFNTQLRKYEYEIVRMFSLPLKKVKSKELVPDISINELKQYFQFLIINVLTEAETYIFSYQNDDKVIPQKILNIFSQDYVIRKQKTKDLDGAKEVMEDWLYNSGLVKNEDEDKYIHNTVYLAYPENTSGANRLIRLTDFDDILKYCQDFSYRMHWKKSEFGAFFEVKKVNMELLLSAEVSFFKEIDKKTKSELYDEVINSMTKYREFFKL